ncbi:MAG TPA: zf-HC2 domain-containing protein [Planctomycetota bacterium]|nr:zf-HC2 domain-containing protein [Planctomycetota bacterium]
MACDWNNKIHLLHDGELDAVARASVESHVSGCAECAAELKAMARVGNFLRAAPMPTINELALARVRQAIVAERNGRRTARLAGWLTAAAALVMLACSAVLYSTSGTAQQSGVANAGQNQNKDAWQSWSVAVTADVPSMSDPDDPALLITEIQNKDDSRD